MKTLRIVLLLLFAVVLPFRGALADAVHCPGGAGGQAGSLAAPHAHHGLAGDGARPAAHAHHGAEHGMHHGHGEAPADALALAEPAADVGTGAGGGSPDLCKFCSAFCSITPFMNPACALMAFITQPATSFPALVAPPPNHLSDVQDRPPQAA